MLRILHPIRLAAAALAILLIAGCGDDGVEPSGIGSSLVGDWAVVDETSSRPVDGFRITSDFEIEILGVDWSTGELASTGRSPLLKIVEFSPWREVTFETTPVGFMSPIPVRATYRYLVTDNTLELIGKRISQYVRPEVTYRRVVAGMQVVDPVVSTLSVDVSNQYEDFSFQNDLVATGLTACARYTPSTPLLPEQLRVDGSSFDGGSVRIVLSGAVQPGTFTFDNVTSYAMFIEPANYSDFIPAYPSVGGTLTIDAIDLENRRVTGSFEAALENTYVLSNGHFDVYLDR